MKSLEYNNFPLDTASVDILYSNSSLTIEDSYFTSYDTLLNPFNLTDFSTIIKYEAQVKGSFNNLNGKIIIEGKNTTYKKYHLDSIYTEINLNNSIITIDTLSIHKNNNIISIDGLVNLKTKQSDIEISFKQSKHKIKTSMALKDSIWLFNVNGNEIFIQDVLPFIPDIPKWSGLFSFNLDVKTDSNMKNPVGKFYFTAIKPSFHNTVYVDSAWGTSTFHNNKLSIDTLQLFLLDESSTSHMTFNFSDSSNNHFNISHTSGNITAKDIDLEIFNPFLPSDYTLSGISTHDLSWNGTLSKPNLDGFFIIKGSKIIYDDNDILFDDINTSILISDTLIKIDSIAFISNSVPLMTHGKIDIIGEKLLVDITSSMPNKEIVKISGYSTYDSIRIDASIIDFNLSFIRPFIPQLHDLDGELNSSIQLNGDIKDPNIYGDLLIKSLKFKQDYINAPIKNGIVSIKFLNDKITVDTLNLPINNGSISLNGDIGVRVQVNSPC